MSALSSLLGVSAKTVDSSLNALFSASTGPVKPPSKTSKTSTKSKKAAPTESAESSSEEVEDDEDEVMGEADEEEEEEEEEETQQTAKERKRKRKQADEELETKYLQKLADEDDKEKPTKRRKNDDNGEETAKIEEDAEKDDEDSLDAESDASPEDLVHESLKNKKADGAAPDSEIEKANRTVFLANVASDAATNKAQKKALMAHLSTVLDTTAKPAETIESVRFRSLAFSTTAMPKRAAFITKATQEATTKSCNAYVVYSTVAAARKACTTLNGTTVLDRHLRVDSVAHPAATDGRRCVFVGNLGFVDDESVFKTDAEGNTEKKKRNKVPSDIEEGLWRVFNQHAGPVESVRVIRDPKTRIGKGFAYVQFHDANHVEKALLLNDKKFAPMLPRPLRVTRAKDPRKTTNALERSRSKAAAADAAKAAPKKTSFKHVPKVTNDEQTMAGRATKLLGRAGGLRQVQAARDERRGGESRGKKAAAAQGGSAAIKTPETVVLEGRRASSNDGKPKDMKFGKKKGGARKRPLGRRAQRSADWKKKGGAK